MEDVIIVGAGPAGLSCAKNLKNRGFSVKIIEEHKEIGLPVKCSGLVSWNLSRFIEIDDDFIEKKTFKAVINSPFGHRIKLEKNKPVYIINRHYFDKFLSRGMEEDILTERKVISLAFKKNHVVLNTDKGSMKAKMIVGADGPNSVVGRHLNCRQRNVIGLIAITNEKPKKNNVNLFYDRKITEKFLWKIPRKDKTEYGMMGKGCKVSDLVSFFDLKNYELTSGLIPVKPPERTYSERCLLLGDAAGQVKPWSGGGVIYSLLCSKIASDVIEEAFDKNDFSKKFLKKYQNKWKSAIGKQMNIGNLWNFFLEKSNNYLMELFFLSLKLFKLNLLDMDFIFSCSSKDKV